MLQDSELFCVVIYVMQLGEAVELMSHLHVMQLGEAVELMSHLHVMQLGEALELMSHLHVMQLGEALELMSHLHVMHAWLEVGEKRGRGSETLPHMCIRVHASMVAHSIAQKGERGGEREVLGEAEIRGRGGDMGGETEIEEVGEGPRRGGNHCLMLSDCLQ